MTIEDERKETRGCFSSVPSQGKTVTVNAEAESKLEEALINSGTQRNSYQRFLRRMVTRKAAQMHPDLVKAFNEKNSRAGLFVDWFKHGEDLPKVQIAHQRRIVRQRKSTSVLKPMRRAKILAMFDGDEAHTELVVQNAVKLGRWRKDTLNPTDESKTVYWVTVDESIEFNNINEQEFLLDGGEREASDEQAKQLLAPGGFFDEDGDISAAGLSAASVAALATAAFNPPAPGAAPVAADANGADEGKGGTGRGRGNRRKGNGRGNGQKGDGAKGDGKGNGQKGDGKDGGIPPTVTKDTPYKEANKLMKSTAGA